eukprot:gene5427-5971_t
MMYDSLTTFDLSDLIRGDGEWKNMQEVIRRTFRLCIENQQRQAKEILHLHTQLNTMRDELHRKPSWEDMTTIRSTHAVTSTNTTNPTTRAQSLAEEELRFTLTQLKAAIDEKVSQRTLETLLKKKVDRDDHIIRQWIDNNPLHRDNNKMKEIQESQLEILTRLKQLENEIHQVQHDYDSKQQKRDLVMIRSQIDNLYRHVGEFHTKEHIQRLLDQKVSQVDLATALGYKADMDEVQELFHGLEVHLERHEKQLTSLRLSSHDTSVFRDEITSRRHGSSKNRGGSSSSHRQPTQDDSNAIGMLPSRREFEESLREGRLEAVVSRLYQQTAHLSMEVEQSTKTIASIQEDKEKLTQQISTCANKQTVEVLAVVVEEQRLRTDSIIQGSIKIKPVYKDLKKLENDIQQVHDYLQLPHKRPLPVILEKIGTQLQEFARQVEDVKSKVQEACVNPLDGLRSRVDLIETIWQAYEVDRDRLRYLLSVIDFKDTPYNNIYEMSRNINQLYFILQGDAFLNQLSDDQDDREEEERKNNKKKKDSGIISSSKACVINRIYDLERESQKLTQSYASCQRALLAIKSLLVVDGKLPSDHPISINSNSNSGSGNNGNGGNSPSYKKKVSVDFDVAMGPLLPSLDDFAVPVQSTTIPINPMNDMGADLLGQSTWSVSDIDQRLHQLQQQKEEVRKKLLAEVHRNNND